MGDEQIKQRQGASERGCHICHVVNYASHRCGLPVKTERCTCESSNGVCNDAHACAALAHTCSALCYNHIRKGMRTISTSIH